VFFALLEQGDAAEAGALLDEHALDVDARREEGGPTALHVAAASGDAAAVQMLLRHGADRTLRFSGMTPADVARSMGFTDVVAILS
jgi:ankyrin repeat protein